jgi:hypothetical protein
MEDTGRQPGTSLTRRDARGRIVRTLSERPLQLGCGAGIALLLTFLAPAAIAQQHRPTSPVLTAPDFPSGPQLPEPGMLTGNPTADPFALLNSPPPIFSLIPVDTSKLVNSEACDDWTAAAVNSPTVSVSRLEVPSKASSEFQRACGALKDNRLGQAEDYAGRAIKLYPQYAAAWVMLGQILEAEHKDDKGRDACEKAVAADPRYAPPYICLAGFAARANDWEKAYKLSDHALSLDPATNMYAFLSTATADLHLKRLDDAEFYGRSAEKLDKWHHLPAVHLLLAKVYEAKGDRSGEIQELREYLKVAPHAPDADTAKTTLAKIEDRPTK